jgi:hypothetical protein
VSKFNRDVESILVVTKGAEKKYIKMIQINQTWRHPKCMERWDRQCIDNRPPGYKLKYSR